MEGGLPEPAVVFDAVFEQIPPQPLDVQRQGIGHKGGPPLFPALIHISVAVNGGEILRMVDNVLPVVGILRHFNARRGRAAGSAVRGKGRTY